MVIYYRFGGWRMRPRSLLNSFPLITFLEVPSTFLKVTASILSTAFLLWKKNSKLFVIVLIALLIKQNAVENGYKLKRYIWWRYLQCHVPENKRTKQINIFQVLKTVILFYLGKIYVSKAEVILIMRAFVEF